MVAICLSLYNGDSFLKEQLNSIEQQSGNIPHIILLVRDDGSTDTSYELVKEFIQNTSLHVELLDDRTKLGVKKSFEFLMNKAVAMNAQYIMFCDQDDVWYSDKIQKTLNKMKELEKESISLPLLVHSDITVVNEKLDIRATSFWEYQHINPARDKLHYLVLHNVVTGCTMMINHVLAKKIKTIPPEAIMHDWWIAMVASTFGKVGYIDKPLMLYRQHEHNDTGAKKYGFKYILNKFLAQNSFHKYIIQTDKFLEIYKNDLDGKTKEMLQAFQQFPSLNKLEKIRFLFKYKIWKYGIVRNLGLILFI